MARIALVIVGLLCPSLAGAQHFMTGNSALALCRSDSLDSYQRTIEEARCMAYVRGLFDASTAFLEAGPLRVGGREWRFCPPDGMVNSQVRDVFIAHLLGHPSDRHLPAGRLFIASMLIAFPCR